MPSIDSTQQPAVTHNDQPSIEHERPPIIDHDEDEDSVPITGLGYKLLQLEQDQEHQRKRKKKSFQYSVFEIEAQGEFPPDKEREPVEDSKDDGSTSPHQDRRPKSRSKRVRFLGFDDVLMAQGARAPVDFCPKPLPPPPLPPNFFEKPPDAVTPHDIPLPLPPPPPEPQPLSQPFVPRPPPLLGGFTFTPQQRRPEEPTPPVTENPRSVFISDQEGDIHINEKAFKLYTKFIDEIAEFVRLQVNVTRKRVEAQERRAMQRRQRSVIHQSDAHLFRSLQVNIDSKSPNLGEVSSLFEASRKARDDAVPLDEHYEALELELGAAEYALAERFGALERRYENFFRLHGASISTSLAKSSVSYESTDPDSEKAHSNQDHDTEPQYLMHGAVVGAAVKVGQTPIQLSHAPQISTVPVRSHTPTPRLKRSDGSSEPLEFSRRQVLSIESIANFNESELTHESHQQVISESIRGIGYVSAGDYFDIGRESSNILADEASVPQAPLDVHPAESYGDHDSLLLLGSDCETRSTLSDYLMTFDSTRDRINRWMLHKLRVSPREVFELRREVELAHPDVPDWANRALDMWSNDEIGYGAKYTPGSEESDETSARPSVPRPYPSTPPKPVVHKRPGSKDHIPGDFFLHTFDEELQKISEAYTDTALAKKRLSS